MALKIVSARADRRGGYIANVGSKSECRISLNPMDADPNAEALLAWLRVNKADPWAASLDEAKQKALRSLPAWIDEFLSPFTEKYPKHERDAWPLLAIAAKAHLAGDPQRMILNEAAIVGADPDTVAAYIVQKHETLADIVDHARGLRQVTEAAIMAATSPAEVEAALSIAQGQALDMLDAVLNPEPVAEL
ncbi:MAG: hypothetical protein E6Q97_31620 [Desulfurellales bacterium]|nr:MAG: hypothetical protein E6Q97_31620 [Desulfurellales bacterium]